MSSTALNNSAVSAFARLKKNFNLVGFSVLSERVCNKSRDLFLVVSKDAVVEKFYVKFRRDVSFNDEGVAVGFFLTFHKQFPEFFLLNSALGAVGESINIEVLNEAIRLGVDRLLFCYGDGKVYWIYPALFKKFSETNNLIRKQEAVNYYNAKDFTGQSKGVNEVTYCVPVKLLNRFEFGGAE